MATLQNIRNRAGLLVAIVIGLALFAFILGDMMGSGSSALRRRSVAEINGKGIGVNDYMNREQALREFYELNSGGQSLDAELEKQIQQETWNRLVRETIMDRAYSKLGLYVSADELKTMITGDQSQGLNANPALSQPHPIIQQMFSNPETGELNRTLMTNYFNSLDNPQFAQEKKRWLFIENEIVEEKMNQKYFNLIRKGMQPSSLDLKDYLAESKKSTDFAYVSRPFTEISDEDISISDADLKAYLKQHREAYRQDASRTFQYVVFEVEPSEKDVESARYWSAQTKIEFSRISGEEIPRYVNSTSDEPFDQQFYTYEELPEIIRDSVFNASQSTIVGPYRDEESFKLSRLYETQMRPDSVRARHILLSLQAYGGNRQVIKETADSLLNVLNSGGSFNQIAQEYSADESNRAIGGDLGWFTEGTMVSAFSNACFENATGDIVTAETQFGTHIIRIDNQSRPVKKVQVATIVRNIFASDETNQDYYNRAVKFRGKATDLEKFTEQAREFGLDPRFAPDIAKDQTAIPGIDDPIQIIKWAYTSDVGSVSNIFSQDDKYIVAVLTEAHEEGYADVESVRPELTLAVKKKKKAEKLVNQMDGELAGVTDLAQFGADNDLNVGEATQIKFANTYVAGVGLEPFVVGFSMYLPLDQISEPLIGESGVFVISVTNRTEEQMADSDRTAARTRLKYALESRSNYDAYTALVDAAHVKDNRLEIFYN
jgi:peptidyl-prolyl cis-trans isomerase D